MSTRSRSLAAGAFLGTMFHLASAQGAEDVNWTLDSQEWQNFNTPSAWSNLSGPAQDDWANIGTVAGTTAKVRIDTVLPLLRRICLSTVAGATSTVEITTGGKVVLTNDWNQALQLNANRSGTGCDAWSELLINGGTLEFNDVEPAERALIRGAIGIASASGAAGHAKVVMTNGRILVGNGITIGRADTTSDASYEQSGGRLEFGVGGSGFTVGETNGSVNVTGGEIVMLGSSCNNSFIGPAFFRNCLYEFGSITINNRERDPRRPPAFTIGEGAVITGKLSSAWIRITDGMMLMDGGKTTGYQIQFNSGAGQVAHMQMNGGSCSVATLTLANSADGISRYIQTGGTFRGSVYLSCSKAQASPVYLEISGGTFSFDNDWSYGFPVVNNLCTNSMIFCVRGTPEKVSYFHAQRLVEGVAVQTNRMHHLFLIDPRGLSPLTINNGGSSAGYAPAGRFAAHCSVHPWGGAQLITTNEFVLVQGTAAITDYNNATNYLFDFPLARPDPRLWHWHYMKVGNKTDRDFGVTLTNTAAVANGFTSVEGVPCGYFEIPPVNTASVSRVSVWLGIEPKGGNTLAGLVAELNEKSGCTAVIAQRGNCNVRVDLPLERLGDHATDRRFLFDFTREESPKAFQRGEIVIDAVVTALDFEKANLGLLMMFH